MVRTFTGFCITLLACFLRLRGRLPCGRFLASWRMRTVGQEDTSAMEGSYCLLPPICRVKAALRRNSICHENVCGVLNDTKSR